MTLRQKLLLKKLPENNYNVPKTAKEVGYSESYANTHVYKNIRKYQGNEDEVREEFLRGLDKDIKRFKREQDNSNYVRVKELKTRILGLGIEKHEIKTYSFEKQQVLDAIAKSCIINIPPPVVGDVENN